MKIYVVYDRVAECSLGLFDAPTDGAAKRLFAQYVVQCQNRHIEPKDVSLYRVLEISDDLQKVGQSERTFLQSGDVLELPPYNAPEPVAMQTSNISD